MAFKLGKARQPIATNGIVDKKLSFRTDQASIPGNEVVSIVMMQFITIV